MSEHTERLIHFVKDTALLRKDLVRANTYGPSVTLELSGSDLSAITYALAVAYLTEWVSGEYGNEKLREMISDASATILGQSSSEAIDEAINRILSSKVNPEDDSDGA